MPPHDESSADPRPQYSCMTSLVTSEDPGHVHKVLGAGCLLHFAYRFARCGAADMGFGVRSWATPALLLMHALLSASSLVFRLPHRRIREGSRIWPEYRAHSIIFALRSLTLMLLYWAEQRWRPSAAPVHGANVLVVFGTMLAADAASRLHRDAASNTIRDLSASPLMRLLFSTAQIHATAACLIGSRRFTVQFVMVFVVQLTAFMMTLRRKNIVSHRLWVGIYGSMLCGGFGLLAHEMAVHSDPRHVVRGMGGAISSLAALLRLRFRVDKYILWAGCAGLMALGRSQALQPYRSLWPRLNALCSAAFLAVGVVPLLLAWREGASTAPSSPTSAKEGSRVCGTPRLK